VLDVFRTNTRAARLYESLGFVRVAQNDIDVTMRLEPTV
jgi:ribosomal protein S18 acetylase RimI-like enzyme